MGLFDGPLASGPVILALPLSYHSIELLLACRLLRLRVVILSLQRADCLPDVASATKCSVALLAGEMRHCVDLPNVTCFHLDAGYPDSLISDASVRGPDFDILYSGQYRPRLPISFPNDDAEVIIEDFGFIRSSWQKLESAAVYPDLNASSLVSVAFSGMHGLLSVALLLQAVSVKACVSLCPDDLMKAECTVAHLSVVPPAPFRAHECVAAILCEPLEAEALRDFGFENVLPIILSHTTDFPPLDECYKVSDHLMHSNPILPTAAALLAASHLGIVKQFHFTRPIWLGSKKQGHFLKVNWSRDGNCSVRGASDEHLASFVSSSAIGLPVLPGWCSDALDAATTSVSAKVLYNRLAKNGLYFGNSFRHYDESAQVSKGRARVRLCNVPQGEISIGLLNSILYSPLYLMEAGAATLMPRRIDSAHLSNDSSLVASRCFVKETAVRTFDIVAISSKVQVVAVLRGVMFDPFYDPVKCELFRIEWKPFALSSWAFPNVVYIGEKVDPLALLLRDYCKLRCVSLSELGTVSSTTFRDSLAVSQASESLLRYISDCGTNLVVWSEAARNPLLHGQFCALARTNANVRVVDFDGSPNGGQFLDALFSPLARECRVLRLPGALARAFTQFPKRHKKLKVSRKTGSVAVVAPHGGDIPAQFVRTLEALAVDTWVVGRVNSGTASNFLPMTTADDGAALESGLKESRASAAFLCPKVAPGDKGWNSFTRSVQMFASSLPSACRGIVCCPVEALLGRKTSVAAMSAAEFCLALGIHCLVFSKIDATILTEILQVDSKCVAVGYFPVWYVEEEEEESQRPRTHNDNGRLREESVHVSAIFATQPPAKAMVAASQMTVEIVGHSSRTAQWPYRLLRDHGKWNQDVWNLKMAACIPSSHILLLETLWVALNCSNVEKVALGSSCVISCADSVGNAASRIDQVYCFNGRVFGLNSCSIRAMEVAVGLLGPKGIACVVSAHVPADDSSSEAAVCVILRATAIKSKNTMQSTGVPTISQFYERLSVAQCMLLDEGARSLQCHSLPRAEGLIVLTGSQHVHGLAGVTTGLVGLAHMLVTLRNGRIARNPTPFTASASPSNYVVPLEEILVPASSLCVSKPVLISGASSWLQVIVRPNKSATKPGEANVHFIGVIVKSFDQASLGLMLQRHAEWLQESPDAHHSIRPRVFERRNMSAGVVVWAASMKTMVAAITIASVLQDSRALSQVPKPIAAPQVWFVFSPQDDGIESASEALLELGVGSHSARAEQLVARGFQPSGRVSSLLHFYVLAFDWLQSVIAVPTALHAVGSGVATRAAVGALSRDTHILEMVAQACARDDEALKRNRIVGFECFAPVELIRSVMLKLPNDSSACVNAMGPLSSIVTVKSSHKTHVVSLCNRHSIRFTAATSESLSLMHTLVHENFSLSGSVLPLRALLSDFGRGWSDCRNAGRLWTEPSLGNDSLWASPTDGAAFFIEIGPMGVGSLSPWLRKSARNSQACSLFGRVRGLSSLPMRRLADCLDRITRKTALMPIAIASDSFAPFDPFTSCRDANALVPELQEQRPALLGLGCGKFIELVNIPSAHLFELSWRALIMRHECLRTVISIENDCALILSPDVAAAWHGISVTMQDSFDPTAFPRFCAYLSDTATICLCVERLSTVNEAKWWTILSELDAMLQYRIPALFTVFNRVAMVGKTVCSPGFRRDSGRM